MDKKNCLQKEAGAKKLFATTTTPKKIVCVDEMSIPPLQKNNGPSLIVVFIFCSCSWLEICFMQVSTQNFHLQKPFNYMSETPKTLIFI
jgi:hypothetical protein